MIRKILSRKKLKLESPTPEDDYSPVVHHTNAQIQHKHDKKRRRRDSLTTLGLLIIAPLIAVLMVTFVFRPYEVDGPSMEKTLQNNDRLIIYKLPKTWSKITGHSYIPERGEIIVFSKNDLYQYDGQTKSKQLIKRVIGLPNDRVVVQNGQLTIFNDQHPNGFLPDETYGYKPAMNTTTGNIDIKVAEDEVFVCGDNRSNSLDSRTFGPIPVKDIVGRVSFRVLPLGEAKKF